MNLFYHLPAGTKAGFKTIFIFIVAIFICQHVLSQGNALSFNGTNQFAAVDNNGTEIANEYTVEAWVLPKSTTGSMEIFSTRNAGFDFSFDMKLANGNSVHADIGDGTKWLSTTADAALNYKAGTWYHIAYTVSLLAGTYIVYVNGSPLGSGALGTAATLPLFNANNHVGYIASNAGATEFFNGEIDEFKIYSSRLSKTEVQTDMLSLSVLPGRSNYIYYNFNNGTGHIIGDGSGNGLDGNTLNGQAWVESYAAVMPTSLSATNITITGFTANWAAAANGTVNNYLLDVTTDTTSGNFLTGYNAKSISGSAASAAITGVKTATVYYYRVRADKTSVTGQGANTYYQACTIPALAISSLSASSANVGSSITINGTGFNSAAANNIVYFGGVKGTVTAATATALTVTVPAGALYSPVTVTTSGFTAYSGKPFSSAMVNTTLDATSFTQAVDFTSQSDDARISLADLDGDGKNDLIEDYNSNFNNFSIYRNTSTPGNISFGTAITRNASDIFGSASILFTATADFDGDGKLDMAVAKAGQFAVLQNTSTPGNISFTNGSVVSFSRNVSAITAADMNGDGMPDIVIESSSSIVVFQNTTTGGTISFDGGTNIDVVSGNSSSYRSLALADLNNDNKTDIILTNPDRQGTNPGATFTVLQNTSTGGALSFMSPVTITTRVEPLDICTGDFDGDGKLDVAVDYRADFTATGLILPNALGLFFNTSTTGGTISFAEETELQAQAASDQHDTKYNIRHFTAGDINGDGKIDLLVADGETQPLLMFLNTTSNGIQSFGTQNCTVGSSSYAIRDMVMGDIDSDGQPDIPIAKFAGSSLLFSVIPNQIGHPVITSFTPNSGGVGTSITIAGTGFTGATAVSIGGTPALSFNVTSATSITAIVGKGTSGKITITTPLGSYTSSSSFTYNAATPPGNALSLNGTTQYATVAVPSPSTNTIANEYTVEAWVQPKSASGTMEIFSTRGVTDKTFDMKLTGGMVHGDIGNGSNTWYTIVADAPLNYEVNRWYHIAYVVSASAKQYYIYINGHLAASSSLGTGTVTPSLIDGNHGTAYIGYTVTTGEYFNGEIDELKVFTSARSQAEVQADMVSTAVSSAMAMYYRFDENAGTTLVDFSNNSWNGSFVNSPAWATSYAMTNPALGTTTNIAATSFTINWTKPTIGAVSGYKLDVATSADFAAGNILTSYTNNDIAAGALSQNITGLTQNTTYYYRLSAYNNATTDKLAYDTGSSKTIPSPTWTGATSNDWNTAANWSTNAVPTATDDVSIPSAPINQPTVTTAATAHAINNGGTLTVSATGTLSISGDVTSSGTFTAIAGNIVYNGTTAQTIAGTITVNNLTVNNTAGVMLFSGTTKVYGTYTPQAGSLNANGKLVMASTAAGTSNIAQGSGTYLTGGITVERYIPAHRAWRLLTAPLSQPGTIYNNWQNGGVADGSSGAVIFKPGASGTDGYTAGGGEASMEYYDEVQDKWLDVANTNATSLGNNNTSAANQAYAIFITGPYGSNNISPSQAALATTLRASGLPQTGNQTFAYTPGTAGHYMLTGNPYASPVDMAAVVNRSTGIAQQFWIWDPNRSGTTVGGYVTFTKVGSDYINDMTGQTLQTTVLQSGEAVFTQANMAGTVTIQFTEADKTNASTSTNGVFFAPTPSTAQLLRVALNRKIKDNMTAVDGVLAVYDKSYNKDATDDAAKLYNYDENLTIRINSDYIAIQKTPLPQNNDSLWLNVSAMKANNSYSFTIKPQNIPTTLQAWIVDRYLNTKTPVDLATNTDVAFITTADKASYAETRFVVVFATQGALASTLTNVKAWQQDKTNQVEWTTATEQGIQQYIVEKSTDGQSFKQIGLATAPRNTGKTEVYEMTDENPVVGDNYYRVQIINKDAAPAYSNVVTVKILKGKPAFTASPNPVQKSQQLHVTCSNMDAGKYVLVLYSSDGKKVLQRSVTLNGTSTTQTIKLPLALASAAYRLVLVDEKGHSWTQQVVVE